MTTLAAPFVVVVDPQRHQRRALCRLLRGIGAREVVDAPDAQGALTRVAAKPDVAWIVTADLDTVNMAPDLFLRALAAEAPAARLLLLTNRRGQALDAIRELVRDGPVTLLALLRKPPSAEEVGTVLTRDLVAPRPAPNTIPASRRLTAADFTECLREGRMRTYFEPRVALDSGRPVGFEASARIMHPTFGILAPRYFEAALEQAGAQRAVTASLLRDAASLVRTLQADGIKVPVSIRLTADAFSDLGDAATLEAYIHSLAITPAELAFEITPGTVLLEGTAAANNLRRLASAGFVLVIDDYGPHSPPLEQLLHIPFAELKFADAVFATASDQPAASNFGPGAVTAARRRGLITTAVGIETPTQLERLRTLCVDRGQGGLFAPAMRSQEALAWMLGEKRQRHFVAADRESCGA